MKNWIIGIAVVLLLAVIFFNAVFSVNGLANFKKESFDQKRARDLNELSLSIEEAAAQGKYNCCVTPPCTMCYLGNWIWKDGICRCDEMVAKGEFDKVCPQCKGK